ncbi:MAG: hypothetical protein H7Y01_15250 [Ferruginibacter sp.]|nr:hypothetical protein [Chitinophagaceae bacterium]
MMDGRWPSPGQRITDNEQRMMITRHNYEEYFILYMDNELSSDHRRLVEAFVQLHPDLKEELDLLLQYKLVPDTAIVFNNKEELMIPEVAGTGNNISPVTLSNYEEWLVLYIDNELTGEQKISVEQFIGAHPSIKEELALLQRTQLREEKIVFPGKAVLYRKEEKVKSMPVRWWRVAAAAVLLLGIGITTALVVNKRSSGNKGEIVKGNPGQEKTNTPIPVITPVLPNTPVNENSVADNIKQVVTPVEKQAVNNVNNNIAVKQNNSPAKNKLPVRITPLPVKEEPVIANNKPSNDLPKPLNNPNSNKNIVTNKDIANIPEKTIKQQAPLTNPVVTTQNPQSSDIVTASFNADDAELDQPSGKKGKLRGFFRKVTRTFEKRTDIDATDDNKLLVAGLSFKLK